MANQIDANIRVTRIRFSPKEDREAKVTFELDFGENRCKKPSRITIRVKPDYACANSALSLAREELAKCLSLMTTQLKSNPIDDWA